MSSRIETTISRVYDLIQVGSETVAQPKGTVAIPTTPLNNNSTTRSELFPASFQIQTILALAEQQSNLPLLTRIKHQARIKMFQLQDFFGTAKIQRGLELVQDLLNERNSLAALNIIDDLVLRASNGALNASDKELLINKLMIIYHESKSLLPKPAISYALGSRIINFLIHSDQTRQAAEFISNEFAPHLLEASDKSYNQLAVSLLGFALNTYKQLPDKANAAKTLLALADIHNEPYDSIRHITNAIELLRTPTGFGHNWEIYETSFNKLQGLYLSYDRASLPVAYVQYATDLILENPANFDRARSYSSAAARMYMNRVPPDYVNARNAHRRLFSLTLRPFDFKRSENILQDCLACSLEIAGIIGKLSQFEDLMDLGHIEERNGNLGNARKYYETAKNLDTDTKHKHLAILALFKLLIKTQDPLASAEITSPV